VAAIVEAAIGAFIGTILANAATRIAHAIVAHRFVRQLQRELHRPDA
jgi:hypothetical protein